MTSGRAGFQTKHPFNDLVMLPDVKCSLTCAKGFQYFMLEREEKKASVFTPPMVSLIGLCISKVDTK